MHFLDLPVEVGILILNYLETKSKINVYNSCKEVRSFFAPCHVKRVVLSRSVLATTTSIQEHIFVDLAKHIKELNLSGVPDLYANNLKPFLSNLKTLVTLDITFTNIYLSEFVDLCPKSLKNISANFFKTPRQITRGEIWEKCRQLFEAQAFEYVHLVVFDLVDSDMPLLFLDKVPTIKHLVITVADNYKDFWNDQDFDAPTDVEVYDINFSKLSYTFRDCRVTHKTTSCLRGVANLDYDQIEYIYIMYLEKIVIYASPAFKHLFQVTCSDLKVDICRRLPLGFMLDGNIVFKAWNKRINTFDDEFIHNLLIELKNYFPSYLCRHSKTKMEIVNSPNDWYCIDACEGFEKLDDLPDKVTLTDFCRKDGAVIRCNRPIRLTREPRTLRNITFLRLSNICLRDDFFTVLFTECANLETLDVYVEKRGRLSVFRGYTAALSKAINLTKSLKNVKITSEDIEYDTLFEALGRCPSLENIHICEYERALDDTDVDARSIILVIQKCLGLYSLFIEADMSPESLTLLMCPLREACQRLRRDHLCVEVCDCYRGWNPFVDVFNPSPLHILD